MKIMRKLLAWVANRYKYYTASRYTFEYVSDTPLNIPKFKVFVICEGSNPDSLVFKCPCGCQVDIHLNLLTDASPSWEVVRYKKHKHSIYPSVWRTTGCRSHFFLRNNKIIWV